jgi:hypothetical protein
MSRPRAIVSFIVSGGLLLILGAPHLIHLAVIKTIPWSVPIIVIPMYAFLSYAAFRIFWPHIVQRHEEPSTGKDTKRN